MMGTPGEGRVGGHGGLLHMERIWLAYLAKVDISCQPGLVNEVRYSGPCTKMSYFKVLSDTVRITVISYAWSLCNTPKVHVTS